MKTKPNSVDQFHLKVADMLEKARMRARRKNRASWWVGQARDYAREQSEDGAHGVTRPTQAGGALLPVLALVAMMGLWLVLFMAGVSALRAAFLAFASGVMGTLLLGAAVLADRGQE